MSTTPANAPRPPRCNQLVPPGNVSALYILTRHQAQRFEFIFTALAPDSGGPELLAVVQGMSQAYEASRLYRELKLRGERKCQYCWWV